MCYDDNKRRSTEILKPVSREDKIFGIIYRDDRGKNQKTLEELEIVPSYRKVIIENLIVEDYVEGPVIDVLNQQGEMWVFGKDVKGREVYIKITLGYQNGQTICISFHIAEHPMQYPFKYSKL